MDLQQAVLHGLDVGVRTVTFWEGRAALAPTVIPLADELALGAASDVAGVQRPSKRSRRYSGQQHLQA